MSSQSHSVTNSGLEGNRRPTTSDRGPVPPLTGDCGSIGLPEVPKDVPGNGPQIPVEIAQVLRKISTGPIQVAPLDIHTLLKAVRERPDLAPEVITAVSLGVKTFEAGLAEILLNAGHAALLVAENGQREALKRVVLALMAVVVDELPARSQLKREAYEKIKAMPLTTVEWVDFVSKHFKDRPDFISILRASIARPREARPREVVGGESWRQLICVALDSGLRPDDVVSLLSRFTPRTRERPAENIDSTWLPSVSGDSNGNVPQISTEVTQILEKVATSPVEVRPLDIYKLLEAVSTSPGLVDGAKAAFVSGAQIDREGLTETVLGASNVALRLAAGGPTEQLRRVVLDVAGVVVDQLPPRSKLSVSAYAKMRAMPFTGCEWAEFGLQHFKDRPEFLSTLRATLRGPSLYGRIVGRLPDINEKTDSGLRNQARLLRLLVDNGALIDEVVPVLGRGHPENKELIKMMLHKVSAGELVLTEEPQRSLWGLIQSKRLQPFEKLLAMDLLTKGGVCESVQRSLAQCLQRLPMKVPVEEFNDRIVIAMCAKIYREGGAIDDLARSVQGALRSQLGVCFVEPEKSLEFYRRLIRLLDLAEGVIASYQSSGRVRRLTIPAGYSDVEAAEALSLYANYWSKRFPCSWDWELFEPGFMEQLNHLYRVHDGILRFGDDLRCLFLGSRTSIQDPKDFFKYLAQDTKKREVISEIERLYDESGAVEVSRDFSTTRRLEYDEAYFVRYAYGKAWGKLRALGLGDADLRDLALIMAVDYILHMHRGARTWLEAHGSLPFVQVVEQHGIRSFWEQNIE